MFMITNRELAGLIWLGLILLYGIRQRGVQVAMIGVLKAFLKIKVVLPLLIFATYIAVWVWLAETVGFWEVFLLKDTILWFVLAGFPLFLKSTQVGKDDQFILRSVRNIFGISVLLEFFLNVTNFSLPAELVMLPAITLLALMPTVVGSQQQYATQRLFWDALLIFTVTVIVIATGREVFIQRLDLDTAELGLSLALLLWLPLVSLPFIYMLALIADYESAFNRMKSTNDRRRPGLASRLALILVLNWQVHEVHAFAGRWAKKVASASTLVEALKAVRDYRRDRARRFAEEQDQSTRLLRYAGVDGIDVSGRRLDQREFAETKPALQWLATSQMGWYKNHGHEYRSDLLKILGNFSSHGLPEEHGIVLRVREDGQAWYAWRRTVSGWVFAIGAAKEPPDEWLYDGASPPQGYPGTDASWGSRPFGTESKNW